MVDLDAREVLEVIDHGVVPLPPRRRATTRSRGSSSPATCPAVERYRDDVKPIEITQPEGPSFTVDGHAVRLAEVAAADRLHARARAWSCTRSATTGRPIVHRASLVEMYVPYGDPAPTHRFKNVFDQGEYGVGWLANPLTLGLRLRRAHPATSTASSTTTTAAPS